MAFILCALRVSAVKGLFLWGEKATGFPPTTCGKDKDVINKKTAIRRFF
jgi:hypothetical protein